ncbi:MAG TPA: MoaD/ThiS family protein [Actinomycetota bacterium]|nr:MoaD/ThiS family protein [Actinomycetota bacterium]
MAVVTLRSPLRDLAGGQGAIPIDGGTVREVIADLERTYPRLVGWVRDETGAVRQHVNVFVNGERAGLETSVEAQDHVHVLASISGGAVETMTRPEQRFRSSDEQAELLVGTRKGLFVLRGALGQPMELAGRSFDGSIVEFAMRDRRSGRYLASVTNGFFGPRMYFADDPTGEWQQAEGPAFPEDADAAIERIWVIRTGVEPDVLWAGVAPAALFRSDDGGATWTLNEGLWNEPSRKDWQPGFGGLCLHSICPWPDDPSRIAIGISAAGVWLSEDGGGTWRRGNAGLVARYLPEEAREGATSLCVHNMHRAPLQPDTLFMQFHGGVYRSDDAGESWTDIGTNTGLPSDFGFPMVIDPHDPDRAFVIPLTADRDRVTPDGQVAVYETRDRGSSWEARTDGLPGEAYLTILRQAFCHDGRRPLGLYFGAESGEVFGSMDGGASWFQAAEHLPPVTSVRCSS